MYDSFCIHIKCFFLKRICISVLVNLTCAEGGCLFLFLFSCWQPGPHLGDGAGAATGCRPGPVALLQVASLHLSFGGRGSGAP